MKILVILLGVLAFPVLAFGAVQVVKEYRSYDNFAQIQLQNGKNLMVYRVEDSLNPDIKCYILGSDVYSPSISCVNSPVVKK